MLVETITFEIRDFKTGQVEEFVIEDTPTNYDLVAHHRFTRGINFIKMFDFQFVSRQHTPKFIEFGATVAESLKENEKVMDIDDVDEMVGTY